ncbi:SulP family inorganic anion transporter [Kordiimonas marina]|uniref:SulP family inorganic anion transporter n=1 Tax=Kordiimonas marina TaxID=2872312 RepID=UPI001FF53EF9|nr:sulfate permease [Kordiimonas marina]MCJ9429610.1 sulfate permease [Kordiimonas marina]
MKAASTLKRFFPILEWGAAYNSRAFVSDITAAIIVTVMLIPQSLAYAMLADLPPEVGLYASMLPLVLYAIFGTGRALAVGPVAVISLMTAAAISHAAPGSGIGYVEAAMVLALLSGLMLLVMGLMRLGFLVNFLSHPVISGFIVASSILIAVSQFKYILGITSSGSTLIELIESLSAQIGKTNVPTLIIGTASMAALFSTRSRLKKMLLSIGVSETWAGPLAKGGPVAVVIITTLITAVWHLDQSGVPVVGQVPVGLPSVTVPHLDMALITHMASSAFLISLIGFVSSISVAQTLAAKRRQRVDPDQELVALGIANIGAGVTGGYPITGGFARSVVNFDAGAETPAAGAFTAIGIAVATIFLTPLLYFLPKATLAATIIVAVLSLIDGKVLLHTWRYSKRDFAATATTIVVTLIAGVELGLIAGVVLSIVLHLYRTSKPHCAIVGIVPGTEHFRNILRHNVLTNDTVLTLRVDESLYFANARFLEDKVYDLVSANKALKHVVLMCPAVNEIDASALESLEEINSRLKTSGVTFHLSEVKGPVMDRLERSSLLQHLTGKVFLSQYKAIEELAPDLARTAQAAE